MNIPEHMSRALLGKGVKRDCGPTSVVHERWHDLIQ